MVKIGNYNLKEKRLLLSTLTQIFGMGRSKGKLILNLLGVKVNAKLKDVINEKNNELIFNMNRFVNMLNIELQLRKKILKNIRKLRIMKTYRGIRASMGLPVNGQRTKSNGNTPKDMWKRGINLPIHVKVKKPEAKKLKEKQFHNMDRKSARFSIFKYQKKKGRKKRTLFPTRRR
jgi:small subunit ribosomal protein S13